MHLSQADLTIAILFFLDSQKTVKRLQLIQNDAARILDETKKSAHITPVLNSLHWLPVNARIDFKVLLLVYKALNGTAPNYIKELLLPYEPTRSLTSSASGLLVVLHVSSLKQEKLHSAIMLHTDGLTFQVILEMPQHLVPLKVDLKHFCLLLCLTRLSNYLLLF